MTKTKPPSNDPPPLPTGPSATDNPRELRINPEVDAKIDAHIRANPRNWAYIQALPRERLERALVLSEVQKLDRQHRFKEGILKELKRNPEMKQAYETLVKNLPEDRREDAMVQIVSHARRTLSRNQTVGQTP